MYVTACNFTKIELLHRYLSKILIKMEKLWRRFAVAKVICSSYYWTAFLKCYFSTHFSHVLIIESKFGSCKNVLANQVETSPITNPLISIWIAWGIGEWFSFPLCIPLHEYILLLGNVFYKWIKLEKTNLKLIEL